MYRKVPISKGGVKNSEGSINRFFLYIKCDSDSEEGQVGRELPFDGSYFDS